MEQSAKRKVVVCVAGTRPEVIKLAPVYRRLCESEVFQPLFLSTGQHREMLAQAMASFGLKADADLGVMTRNQSLADLTASVVQAAFRFFEKTKPAAVLVQGDTTSVLGAGLAAFYAVLPLGHVEAGLRTYDMMAPWPEEMNRRLLAPICRWCFAPTAGSRENLLGERIDPDRIFVTGNTAIDALLWMKERVSGCSGELLPWLDGLGIASSLSVRLARPEQSRMVLVTGHRRESFGRGFEEICQALLQVARVHPDAVVVYPVHLNPKVQEPVRRLLGKVDNIALIEPVGYEDFVRLMSLAYIILSDSGGVQEEAPSLGKPVLVMRKTTERPEGVKAGTCRLVGTDPADILSEVQLLFSDTGEYERRSRIANPYGDGQAADRIVRILERSTL